MIFITFLLALFLLVLVITIIYVFIGMYRENNDLHILNTGLQKTLTETTSKNTELQARIDTLMKQPSALGLSYKTDNKNIQIIADSLKGILLEIQSSSCPLMRKQFDINRKQFIDELTVAIKDTPIKCSDIKTQYDTQITQFATLMTSILEAPPASVDKVKNHFKTLIETVLISVCVNDTIDVLKVDKFLTDMFNAICYKI